MAEVGFDLVALAAAVAAQGVVARVVIAAHDGSSPREVGAAMLIWKGGASGTIGGGALEWEAMTRARAMLAGGGCAGDALAVDARAGDARAGDARPEASRPETSRLDREALGPKLGQCCGGTVSVLTEIYRAGDVAALTGLAVIARPASGAGAAQMPLAVRRILDRARAQGIGPAPGLVQGWMVEPVARADRHIWIWGAGHVGRALVEVLAPLPGLAITWVDVAADRFPPVIPDGVTMLPAADPARLAAHAPPSAEHLVLTYSHALDLELCHRLLDRGFGALGLIGSATKWARFRGRLRALGHSDTALARITCPIGTPALGKHPQAIAIGVATNILQPRQTSAETEITDDTRDQQRPFATKGSFARGGADKGLSGRGGQ
ncbi:MAG: xanthine dehydrogenase accessory protein XdhC [Paracoccaceae bacterium]|nr:xanthine dehydrogenase accessory protein XdhC [Paracoccaceae bacterium]